MRATDSGRRSPTGAAPGPTPEVAVVFVHYRASALLARAVAAVRDDLAAAGVAGELVVVDHGSDAADAARLAGLPVRLLVPGSNGGYAAGVNRGIAATRAPALLVMNPDVEVLPGCCARLLAVLGGGVAAGPRFYWDRSHRLLLPPAERRDRVGELLAALAPRGRRWAVRARRRWRGHARSHWESRSTLRSDALPGALLALDREAWERVGPMDEAYRLYFEETDWLRRAGTAGIRLLHVSEATAVHLHAQSTVSEPRAAQWFEDSARRFRVRAYGAWWNRLCEAVARQRAPLPASSPRPLAALLGAAAAAAGEGPVWIELSPNRTGFPAAAERLVPGALADWTPPADLRDRLPEELHLTVSDARGDELVASWSTLRVARP